MVTVAGLPVAWPKLRASAAALFTVPQARSPLGERALAYEMKELGIAERGQNAEES